MAVEDVDVDVGRFKPHTDCHRKRRERHRILLHFQIGIDAKPAPGPRPATLVVVAHLFRQAKPIRLLQKNPQRAIVGPLQRVEDSPVEHDVLQGVLPRFISESRDTAGIEDHPLLFVVGHAVHGLDQRLDDVRLGLGPVDGRKRGEPTGSEVIVQTGDGGLTEEGGNGGHTGPFLGREAIGISTARYAGVRYTSNEPLSLLASHVFVRHTERAS